MAYKKPQYPLKNGEDYIYPVTTADQVILSNGSRLEQNGKVIADQANEANVAQHANSAEKLSEARAISLTGDVTGTVDFDGSTGVIIETEVYASKYYTATFTSSGWSASAPYTQTVSVSGIKAADNPIVDINMSSATTGNSSDLIAAWGLVGRVATANGSVTAYCYEKKPTIDISVNIMSIK